MKFYFLAILTLFSTTLVAQEKFLLVGTYTKKTSKGIYVYRFNETNGTLKEASVTMATNPSYLAISNNNKNVYAVGENGNGGGAVSAYSFDAGKGELKLMNSQSSNGDGPCHVSIDKTNKWVAVANYSGGNFCIYPVLEDGSLGEAVQNIQHTGKSINTSRQEKPHAHAVVFSPDQKLLAVTDLGIDKIMVYPFDATKQKPLTEKAIEIKTKPGVGPRHIVFHPTMPYAYTIEELSGYVTAYQYKDGKFSVLQSINAHPDDFRGTIGSAAIKISPDGRFLYASNRGESNTIAEFSIDKSGKLSKKRTVSTGGQSPRDFTLDPSGKYLLSTNSNSGSVAVFRRQPGSGLTETPGTQVTVPEPVCLVFMR